jgi:hypothetical protein
MEALKARYGKRWVVPLWLKQIGFLGLVTGS